ncbi:MAG: DNA polymerase III, subunit gamma and tau [candidate division Zixibacteria bacterium RBG_16_53_22]|nr:MAG: DNA polymerase III, subunit gamma and tau [candidate division Zixibacteria bacterium RBG_16_53_22]
MSYLALARRYRPADFEQIQSQGHVTKTLQNAIKAGRISHAYLFCGPRGTGKTTTARVLAKALNCVNGPTAEPCGVCFSCKEIALGSSPDVFEIDAASNRGIDDIRELRENVRYTPVGGRHKIYIVDEVHRLTKEAFDALLKTLEEPPSHVIFIFATTDPQALPATILSRTQRYDFKRIPVSSLVEAVKSVAEKEGLSIDHQAALLVAKKADGSFRDALSLLDQLSGFADGTISAEQASEVLGLVKTEFLAELAGAVIGRKIKDALDMLGEYVKSGGDPQEMADALTGYIRTLLLVKSGVIDPELLELDQTQLDAARGIIADTDIVDLLRYFTILADYKGAIKQGQDPVYALEATLVKISSLDNAVSLQSLLSRLPDTLQGRGGGPITRQPDRSPSPTSKVAKPAVDREFRARPRAIPDADLTAQFGGDIPGEPDSNASANPSPIPSGPLSFELVQNNWQGFCNSVKKNKIAIFTYLKMCNPSKLDGNILTILVESPNNFQIEQLSRSDIKRFVEDSLKAYFGNDIRLKLAQGKAPEKGANSTAADPGQLFDGAPGAKELFDSLGGEVIGQ